MKRKMHRLNWMGGGENEYDVGFNENNMSTMCMRRLRQLYNRIFESGEDDINVMRYRCSLRNTQMKTHLQKENEDLISNREMPKFAIFEIPRVSF